MVLDVAGGGIPHRPELRIAPEEHPRPAAEGEGAGDAGGGLSLRSPRLAELILRGLKEPARRLLPPAGVGGEDRGGVVLSGGHHPVDAGDEAAVLAEGHGLRRAGHADKGGVAEVGKPAGVDAPLESFRPEAGPHHPPGDERRGAPQGEFVDAAGMRRGVLGRLPVVVEPGDALAVGPLGGVGEDPGPLPARPGRGPRLAIEDGRSAVEKGLVGCRGEPQERCGGDRRCHASRARRADEGEEAGGRDACRWNKPREPIEMVPGPPSPADEKQSATKQAEDRGGDPARRGRIPDLLFQPPLEPADIEPIGATGEEARGEGGRRAGGGDAVGLNEGPRADRRDQDVSLATRHPDRRRPAFDARGDIGVRRDDADHINGDLEIDLVGPLHAVFPVAGLDGESVDLDPINHLDPAVVAEDRLDRFRSHRIKGNPQSASIADPAAQHRQAGGVVLEPVGGEDKNVDAAAGHRPWGEEVGDDQRRGRIQTPARPRRGEDLRPFLPQALPGAGRVERRPGNDERGADRIGTDPEHGARGQPLPLAPRQELAVRAGLEDQGRVLKPPLRFCLGRQLDRQPGGAVAVGRHPQPPGVLPLPPFEEDRDDRFLRLGRRVRCPDIERRPLPEPVLEEGARRDLEGRRRGRGTRRGWGRGLGGRSSRRARRGPGGLGAGQSWNRCQDQEADGRGSAAPPRRRRPATLRLWNHARATPGCGGCGTPPTSVCRRGAGGRGSRCGARAPDPRR